MGHLQGFLHLSQDSTHHRTLLQGSPLPTSTMVLHQDLLPHSALLDLLWTILSKTTLLPLEIWNTTDLYPPATLGQGLMVLPGVALMGQSHTEEAIGVGLMVLDSMDHHLIDSIPLKDEEVFPVKGLAA